MNYSKQVIALAILFSSALVFGMQQQPTITTTVIQPRQTLSTETALLFNAIAKNDVNAVEEVFSKLTTEDAKSLANSFDSKGWSALMRAVNNPEIVRLLINKGAGVNMQNKSGITALREAAISGNIDSLKELIRANANIDQADNYGITPLMMAVSQGPAIAALYLIRAGADVNAEDKGGQTVWKYSTISSRRKVSAAEQAEIQKLLEEKGARKESIKKAQK